MYHTCPLCLVGLIKLKNVPEALHTWIKTLATSQGKEIGEYVIEFLQNNLPNQIQAPTASERALELSRDENRQGTIRRDTEADAGKVSPENVRDKDRRKTPRKA
jgi:hypothetical protein